MRYALIVLVLFVPFFALGCGVLDWAVGIDAQGNDLPGDSPVESVGGLLNAILLGSGTALTAIGGIYAAIRRGSKWKEVATEGMDAIESVSNTPVGQQIKARLKQVHVAKKMAKLVKPIVDKYGHAAVKA